MNRLVIATIAAVLLGAPLALAGSTTSNTTTPNPATDKAIVNTSLGGQCTTLGKQFDEAQAKHKSDKNYKEALELRAAGKNLCASHKEADGVKKLESALGMIGVKPKL